MSYQSPKQLLDALTAGSASARNELDHRFGDDLASCVMHMANGVASPVLRKTALRWLEMFLASRDPKTFDTLSADPVVAWREFRNYVMCSTARLLLWDNPLQPVPDGEHREYCSRFFWSFPGPDAGAIVGLPAATGFEMGFFQRPKFVFSGDVVEAAFRSGRLWLLVADGCGKGPIISALMQGVSYLWNSLAPNGDSPPAELLQQIQQQLETHLPDGFFVEAALASLTPSGNVSITAAGGARMLRRAASTGEVEVLDLGGCLLGSVGYPELTYENRDWPLASGDELLLATDGLYDQMRARGGTPETMAALTNCGIKTSIYDHIRQRIDNLLRQAEQDDDISVAWLRAF